MPDEFFFINEDQWEEIYTMARMHGYSVSNFLVETMRRALWYPGYVVPDSQIVAKLAVVDEIVLYRLCKRFDEMVNNAST